MPRRRRTNQPDNNEDPRAERVAVFSRTKMCKFYILGVCAKGSECRYAHAKEELQSLPDLACTKLCKSLINTGQCDDSDCKYAHSKEELRATSVPDAVSRRKQRGDAQASLQELLKQQILTPPATQVQLGGDGAMRPPALITAAADADTDSVAASLNQPPLQMQEIHQMLQQQLGIDPAQLAAFSSAATSSTAPEPMQAEHAQDPAAMQNYAAILHQVGQAAQAHAMEAARLQAMAMHLQSGVGAPAGPPPSSSSGLPPYMWMGGAHDQTPSSVLDRHSRTLGAGGFEAKKPQAVPLAGKEPNGMSRGLEGQPVLIRTETLRSMSSNSLHRMALQETEETYFDEQGRTKEEADQLRLQPIVGQGGGGDSAADDSREIGGDFERGSITVKNTFLDFAPPNPALTLRAVQTAGGRLVDLG